VPIPEKLKSIRGYCNINDGALRMTEGSISTELVTFRVSADMAGVNQKLRAHARYLTRRSFS
jgi:hypothetical protein